MTKKRSRILSFLRLGWSAFWIVVCLSLTALWARSYWWSDIAIYRTWEGNVELQSACASVTINYKFAGSLSDLPFSYRWSRESEPIEEALNRYESESFGFNTSLNHPHSKPFGWMNDLPEYFTVFMPHWCLVLSTMTFAAAPWVANRFSLRTLLIAMTLVALVLGLAVYAARK